MASLKSAMFAGYNKFNDAKVRIGSWHEELAMKELTGVTRLAHPKNKSVFNATGLRYARQSPIVFFSATFEVLVVLIC